MTAARRPREATERKRERVLDATEQIMLEHGYAAVSSRSVAARVGINPPLVHYYVGTLDDLFVAVLRRRGEANVHRMAEALQSEEPLRAWWRLASDPRGTALFIELMAAANHRPALRGAVGELAREQRAMQISTLTTLLGEYDLEQFPPALVAATIQGLAFSLVSDRAAGYETSTDEALASVSALIDRLEEQRARQMRG